MRNIHIVHFLDKYNKMVQNARYVHQDYTFWPKPFCFVSPDMWKTRTDIKWCPSVKYEFCYTDYRAAQAAKRHYVQTVGRPRLKCDGTRAETTSRLSGETEESTQIGARRRQFSRLLAAEVCAISGSNAGYTMFRGSVKGTGHPPPFASSPLTFPPVRHHVPSHFNWSLLGTVTQEQWLTLRCLHSDELRCLNTVLLLELPQHIP